MAEIRTPGVYVQQVDSLSRPLQAPGTGVAGFVGIAGDANKDKNIAVPINSWSQYQLHFRSNGGDATHLDYGVYGFFAAGGRRCYVANIGKDGKVAGDGDNGGGIQAFDTYDEIAIVAAPGFTDAASQKALADHAQNCEDRFAIFDCPESVDNVDFLTKTATATRAPAAADGDGEGGGSRRRQPSRLGPPRTSYGAAYYPWLILPPIFGEKENVSVPPSGHMAGIYARNDARRGVHCPPANYVMPTAIGLTARITREQQGLLNDEGINCIREFANGPTVWGARTRSQDPQWRYINVRRLYLNIRETLQDGFAWAVFSPNDEFTRNSLAFSCRAFLKRQWMNGALVGETPEQAFFVRCDDENNPPETVEAGILNVDIGIRPVQTTEFIVFRFGLVAGGGDRNEA